MLKTTTIHLFTALPGDVLPEWIHLCPAGTFTGEDGRGPFVNDRPTEVIDISMTRGKLALDECHATDLAYGTPAPARGWIVELQNRDDGIWGRVEWTPTGKALMADMAYRGISPVLLTHKDTGRVVQILRAALTNDPNLGDLKTLHHRGNNMDLMQRLRQALGLAEDATDDAVLAAISAAQETAPEKTAHAADMARIASAAGCADGAASVDDIVKALQARDGGDTEAMRQTIVSLQSNVKTLEGTIARDRAVAFVDQAIHDGKPIMPLRDHYIEQHMRDAARVEKEINALVSIHSGGIVTPPVDPADPTSALTPEDKKMIELMGVDPKAFAATRAAENKELL
jgi:Mu-like prophage I protein